MAKTENKNDLPGFLVVLVVFVTSSFTTSASGCVICFCRNSLQFSKPRYLARVFNVVTVGAESYFTFPHIRLSVVWLNATPVTSKIFSDNRSKSLFVQCALLPQF